MLGAVGAEAQFGGKRADQIGMIARMLMEKAHVQALLERISKLPERQQEELAALLEETLTALESAAPRMAPDVRAAFEAASREHQATLAYLKDH